MKSRELTVLAGPGLLTLAGCTPTMSTACGELGETINAPARAIADQFAIAADDTAALPEAIAETDRAFREMRRGNWPDEVNALADEYELELGLFQEEVEDALSRDPIEGEQIMEAAAKFEARVAQAMAPCSLELPE